MQIVHHRPATVGNAQTKPLNAVVRGRRQPHLQLGPPGNTPFHHQRTAGVEHLQGLRGRTHTRSRLDIQQYRGPGCGDAELDLGVVLYPAIWLRRIAPIHREPTLAKMDSRFRPGDVLFRVPPEAVLRQGENTLAREYPDLMAATIRKLFVEGTIHRDIARDIVPVGAVHAAFFQPPRSQKPDQFVGEHDIDIG